MGINILLYISFIIWICKSFNVVEWIWNKPEQKYQDNYGLLEHTNLEFINSWK